MAMRAHELHPALVHAPLALLPAAALVDFSAALTKNRAQARFGRSLWWWGCGSGLVAGLAGLAASQQVRADEDAAADKMWAHGIGNVAILSAALGMALWRRRRPPSVLQASTGLVACLASSYTAYLGGEMVYGHGVGVRAMPAGGPGGVQQSPPLLGRDAPGAFFRDAFGGLRWLFSRLGEVVTGRHRVALATLVSRRSSDAPVPDQGHRASGVAPIE